MELKFPLTSVLILTLLSITALHSAIWNGLEYETKRQPPDEILDAVKAKIMSLGISADYFDAHFKLTQAGISSGARDNWHEIQTRWTFTIGPYEVKYVVIVHNRSDRINNTSKLEFYTPTDSLYPIKTVIPREQAENLLRQCLPELTDSNVIFTRSGALVLHARGLKPGIERNYEAGVNLETHELECKEVVFGPEGIDSKMKAP
jgi:hypothetical protein